MIRKFGFVQNIRGINAPLSPHMFLLQKMESQDLPNTYVLFVGN
jgi:hypothetical protein